MRPRSRVIVLVLISIAAPAAASAREEPVCVGVADATVCPVQTDRVFVTASINTPEGLSSEVSLDDRGVAIFDGDLFPCTPERTCHIESRTLQLVPDEWSMDAEAGTAWLQTDRMTQLFREFECNEEGCEDRVFPPPASFRITLTWTAGGQPRNSVVVAPDDTVDSCFSCRESVMLADRTTRVARVDGEFWTVAVTSNTGGFVQDSVAVVRP